MLFGFISKPVARKAKKRTRKREREKINDA
jgi:hypothetical protein